MALSPFTRDHAPSSVVEPKGAGANEPVYAAETGTERRR